MICGSSRRTLHPRHAEAPRDLSVARADLDQLRRGEAYLLTACPLLGGQPAAIGVPHSSGNIARCATSHSP